MAVNVREVVGGFVTRTKTCPASTTVERRHMLSMTKVLGYGEQYNGVCENCGLPLKVERASWVSETFIIIEEPDLLDELSC